MADPTSMAIEQFWQYVPLMVNAFLANFGLPEQYNHIIMAFISNIQNYNQTTIYSTIFSFGSVASMANFAVGKGGYAAISKFASPERLDQIDSFNNKNKKIILAGMIASAGIGRYQTAIAGILAGMMNVKTRTAIEASIAQNILLLFFDHRLISSLGAAVSAGM